jgi:sarcosine oxidase
VKREFEAIVVGLGGIGSGAAYRLSRLLGAGVLGLEQFEIGQPNGASQDHSRIIRLSYHRPHCVEVARRAYETWAIVEAESGVRLSRRRRTILARETPNAVVLPTGCRFHPRCPVAFDRCRVEEPPLFDLGGGRAAACWLAEPGAPAAAAPSPAPAAAPSPARPCSSASRSR